MPPARPLATRSALCAPTALILDVALATSSPLRASSGYPGAWARGVLLSALQFRACTCTDPRAIAAGRHCAPCPLEILLGETAAGARRFALRSVHTNDRELRFRIVLYGAAVDYVDVLVDALDALRDHGIGDGRVPVAALSVISTSADGMAPCYDPTTRCLWSPGAPLTIAPPWAASPDALLPQATLVLETPLDLAWAQRSEPATAAVSVSGVARSLARRWLALDETRVRRPQDPDLRAAAGSWLAALEAVRVTDAKATWETFTRHSARQHRRMPLSGVRGSFRLAAETPRAARALASLAASAALVSAGARTSFGFGTVALTPWLAERPPQLDPTLP